MTTLFMRYLFSIDSWCGCVTDGNMWGSTHVDRYIHLGVLNDTQSGNEREIMDILAHGGLISRHMHFTCI